MNPLTPIPPVAPTAPAPPTLPGLEDLQQRARRTTTQGLIAQGGPEASPFSQLTPTMPTGPVPPTGMTNGPAPTFDAGAAQADSIAINRGIKPGSLRGAPGVVKIAATQLGEPYVFGSENPDGSFDCSGLTKWAYSRMGVDLPHSANDQMATTTPVGPQQLKPGMLVYYNYGRLGAGMADHVTIYAGNGKVIGSQPSTNGVAYIPIDWDNVIGFGAVPGVSYGDTGPRRTTGPTNTAPSSPRPAPTRRTNAQQTTFQRGQR